MVPYVKRNIAKLRAYADLPDQEVPAPSTCAPDKTPSYKLSVIVLRNGLIVTRRNYRLNVGDTQRQVYWDVLRAFPAGDERRIVELLRPYSFDESLKVFVPKTHAYITLCESAFVEQNNKSFIE